MIDRIDLPNVNDAVANIVRIAREASGIDDLSKLHEQANGLRATAKDIKSACAEAVFDLAASITPGGDYVQRSPNLRIHAPGTLSNIPFHSDHLYGHSEHETNYWLNLTPAYGANSLWMCDDDKTAFLHETLQSGESLATFEHICRMYAKPIRAETPGLYTFCCKQMHGSLKNTTPHTRVSFDIRTIPANAPTGLKKRGGYFVPLWFRNSVCPLMPGQTATTIASLDLGMRVDQQRRIIAEFWPQSGHRELVEFHGLQHMPTTSAAMEEGPAIVYSVRQLKSVPKLVHPLGLADERLWAMPGDGDKLERLWMECLI